MLAIFLTTNVLVGADLIGRPQQTELSKKAEAQAAAPTTFYFRNRSSATHFSVTGPAAEYSSDADGDAANPASKTTAMSMTPVAGPLLPGVTTGTSVTSATGTGTKLLWFRTFIMPLASGTYFNSTSTFTVGIVAAESNKLANAYPKYFVYVYDSAGGGSNAQTLAGPTADATEVGNNSTTSMGLVQVVANQLGAGNYTSNNNDFLAVEVWFTVATAYTVTLNFGGNVAVTDLGANSAGASYITIGGSGTILDTFDPIYFVSLTDPPSNPGSDDPGQSGDTFQANPTPFDIGRMSTVPGSAAVTDTDNIASASSTFYKGEIFMSPPLAAQTIPAGNWLIHLHGYESDLAANAQIRGMIYTWDADDTIGDTIIAAASGGTEWTTATTDNQYDLIWAGSAATITAGERLVAEWYTATISGSGTTYTRNHSFGSAIAPAIGTYDSCILPPMNYASTPAAITWQAAVYDETSYWFDEDNDNTAEGHTTWTNGNGNAIAEHTAAAFAAGVKFRLRIQIRTIGTESDVLAPKIEYQVNSPPGSWIEITTSAAPIAIIASGQANFVDNSATTQRLTAQTGYDFTAGKTETNSSPSGNTTMIRWNYTEYEWCLVGAGTGETYNIRANDNGDAFGGTYTYTPQIVLTGYTPRMNNWQWYGDEATDTSAGHLTTAYAAENTAPPTAEMGLSIPLKLRVNLTELDGVAENNSRKKLQYGTLPAGPWTTVAAIGNTARMWRFYDGGGAADALIHSGGGVLSDSAATAMITEDNTGVNPANSDHAASTTTEWEFCIQNYSATASTTYYFSLQDETLGITIPLGSGKNPPSINTGSYDISITAPASVNLGNFAFGSAAYATYTFSDAEKITIRDNTGIGGYGWSCTAAVGTELNYRDGTFGTPVFGGGGLNDILRQGTYSNPVSSSYVITITANGPADIATWNNVILDDGGVIILSTNWQFVGTSGLQVKWGAASGHTIGNSWTISATAGPLYTIADGSTYWIANNVTGLYGAATTGITTQAGSYMGSAVTSAVIAEPTGIQGLGGFTQIPTIRIYDIEHIGVYTGSLTITLIETGPPA